MSVMQNYGVLRVVCGNHGSREKTARSGSLVGGEGPAPSLWASQGQGFAPPPSAWKQRFKQRHKYLGRWLPEERLTHVLSERETTIGRALSSDIILLDPTVSRDHARLVLGDDGWCVQNVTENNVVRVNDHVVAGGAWSPLQPQDLLVIGNTTLQLVAPLPNGGPSIGVGVALVQEGFVSGEKYGEEGWRQTLSLMSSMTLYFTFKRLGNRPWRFFLVGGLLSIVMIAVVWLVFSNLNNLFGLAQDGPYGLLLALGVPLIPALGINILVHFMDRYEREPWFLRLAAFLWGAIIAIPPSLFIESFVDGVVTRLWGLDSQVVLHAFLSGLDAGLTEETIKGLGLLLLFFVLRDKFDNITDGIVYGALIGAGFAMVENFYYFSGNPNDVSALIVGRIVLGWLSHSTFTICFGVALGYVRHTRMHWRQVLVPWLGFLLAVSLHTVFDFVEIFVRDIVPTYGNSPTVARLAVLAVVGNYIPLFLVQVGILFVLIKSLMHEAAIIREFLPSEVAEGVVTVDEYALLPHSFARIRLENHALRRYGIKQWLLTRALYQAEIGLAFCKWHISVLQTPLPEMTYRKRIKRIREELAALETKRAE